MARSELRTQPVAKCGAWPTFSKAPALWRLARRGKRNRDAEGHERKSFPDGDASLPSARNGLHPHNNLGPISIRRQPTHSELFATKKGAMEKGDLISRLISFARNYRPSMLICGKPKSEHGGLIFSTMYWVYSTNPPFSRFFTWLRNLS